MSAGLGALRERFAPLAEWTGLPIPAEILVPGGRVRRTLVKVEASDVDYYQTSSKRFVRMPADLRESKASEAAIGSMLRPTDQRAQPFARDCWRCILAKDEGSDPSDFEWLLWPVLFPKVLVRPDDLRTARRAIADLQPAETVCYARSLFGGPSFVARLEPGMTGAAWREMEFLDADGEPVELVASDGAVSLARGREVWVRSWAVFLGGFARHPVPFTVDDEGRPCGPRTVGRLHPRPVRLIGANLVGRTDWTGGHRAEIVEEDSGAWERTLRVLAGLTEAELRAAGLAPRSVRAWIGGRPPVSRNRLAAGRLAMQHARTALGGDRHSMPPTTQGQLSAAGRRACIAPGCPVLLTGRQSAFCARHAAYPGARRKAWKVAARR